MKNTRSRAVARMLAASAVATTAVCGMLIATATAHAAPVAGPVTDEIGSLTIHKHSNPGFDQPQNPDGTGGTGGSPLGGVTFKVCLIGEADEIDLIDGGNAAWQEVRDLGLLAPGISDTATEIEDYDLTDCADKTTPSTGADIGVAEFDGLAVGAYLVRETAAPANVVQPTLPFVVTIPTPAIGANAGKWLYDVHVYPKNQELDEPTKTIVNQSAGTAIRGSNIDYLVSQVLPGVPDDVYTSVVMTDELDPRLDPVVATPVTVTLNGVGLAAGGNFSAVWVDRTLTVTFLAPALGILKEGDEITIGFTAVANANGVIENEADVDVNKLVDGGKTTPPVETRWGDVDLMKVNASSQETPKPGIEGAEFELWMGATGDLAGNTGCATDPDQRNNVLVASNIVSGPDGTLGTTDGTAFTPLAGLWVGDSSSLDRNHSTRCYFLVETKAPAGFVLAALPENRTTEFLVHADTTAAAQIVRIGNTQQTVPALPLTGASGQLALVLGGAGLVGLSVILLLAKRRKTAEG